MAERTEAKSPHGNEVAASNRVERRRALRGRLMVVHALTPLRPDARQKQPRNQGSSRSDEASYDDGVRAKRKNAPSKDTVVLVLQGRGALGAYRRGV